MRYKIINAFFTLFILLFSYHLYAFDTIETPMKKFKNDLSKLSENLNGSIITISNKKHNFSYSGPGITEESQFYIGSLTKQMTAFMLLKVLEEQFPKENLEKLLDQNILTLFPNSKFLNEIDTTWLSKINLLDLLTHRSGLSDYIDYYQSDVKNPELINSPLNPVEILQSVKFDPSKKHHYSNTNYFLIGKLIEENQQVSLDAVFERLIKTPAKMDNSHAPIIGNYYFLKNELQFNKLSPDLNTDIFIDMSNAIGAGNVISSTADLLKWNHYLHKETSSKIKKIMLNNYFKDDDGSWNNLGLSTESTSFGPLIGFQGGLDSYHSFIGYLPDYDLTITILSNNENDFENIMRTLEKFLTNSYTYKDDTQLFFKTKIHYAEKMMSKTMSGKYWEI